MLSPLRRIRPRKEKKKKISEIKQTEKKSTADSFFFLTKIGASVLLQVNFACVVQHKIHVLVETNDSTLDSNVHLLVDPDLNFGFLYLFSNIFSN